MEANGGLAERVAGPAPALDALYTQPDARILNGVKPELTPFHSAYLQIATFFVLATGRGCGLDASPRGGPPGFVRALDPRTLAFADWRGNNRIESMRNLVEDDRLGMLFLFPGLEVFLRINGRGRISAAPELLQCLVESGHEPKSAIVVSIDEVLFHCGKAVNRARLWEPSSQVERDKVPSMGQVVAGLNALGPEQAAAIDTRYDDAMRNNLY
ncbi:MSMEG_1061 family FMN-dependent PPOX-type flavoprotein [Roseomonas populi]|uniref:Pyridoxamine 5'-phosphate oxidase family protein n=1 Tax=Roseomonas populi TaxID=3121582 RepID=A0ABT1XBV0_9PROT|nr:MSMEG_1061 family FMN-dependent PPOX-type flavoprotein [Roseomonas pecuniae]MCR0985611.1 pyridoxamine 5'-phosphate oxidase family protein [Roseomonas pecuniae]